MSGGRGVAWSILGALGALDPSSNLGGPIRNDIPSFLLLLSRVSLCSGSGSYSIVNNSGVLPHRKGVVTEAIVIARLLERGIAVATPYGDNERYDLIAETSDQSLLKLQIKSGYFRDGVVEFRGVSQHTNAQGNHYKPYGDDIDYFIVYCDTLDELFLVPVWMVGTRMYLRVVSSRAKPSYDQLGIRFYI